MKTSLEKFQALGMSARMKFIRNACNKNFTHIPYTKKQVIQRLIMNVSIYSFFVFDNSPEGWNYWIQKFD